MLALAGPLVISTVSFTVMTFIDRMFLAWFSLNSVAAAMPAAMLQFTLISFPLGIASYVNTFVAQYAGRRPAAADRPDRLAGRLDRAGRYPIVDLHDSLGARLSFTTSATTPPWSSTRSPTTTCLIYGSGAVILAGTLSSFFTGRGATRVVMAVDIAAGW